jgi:DNA-binding CsgD family transcriptional regulator
VSERDETPPIRIAIAIADSLLADAVASLLAGVRGVILVSEHETADAVLVSADLAPSRHEHDPILTPREHEVLTYMAQGAPNKLIADALGISVNTVKFHVSQIIDKLDAVGRTHAVAQAARIGVIRL